MDRVRRPLEAPYSGPDTVLQRTPKYFLVKMNNDMDTQVSMERLKPYIEVQKQIEKQAEEKMNNNETLSDSEQEINARNEKRRFSHGKYKISFRSNSFLEET